MLRIDDIRLLPEEDESLLPQKAAEKLRLPLSALESFRIVRRSIDARKQVFIVYSVHVKVRSEDKVLKRCRDKQITKVTKQHYAPPTVTYSGSKRPVIVGAGLPVCSVPFLLPVQAQSPSFWSVVLPWSSAKRTWNFSGIQVFYPLPPMSNSEKAVPEHFPTAS